MADAQGDGSALVRRLSDTGVEAVAVPDAGVAAAAAVSELVLLEAVAAGPTGVLAPLGSHAAAAVAVLADTPVWVVTGVGRVLPGPMWDALLARLDAGSLEPWDRSVELVPVALLSEVVAPGGRVAAIEGLARPSCATAPELLRSVG